MKKYYLIIIMVLALVLAFGCSKSPVDTGDVLSEQEAEFKVIEAEFAALGVEDEPEGTRTIGERRIERLGFQLRRLNSCLERLSKFEQKYPNEEARELIRQATRYLNAAIKAYNKQEYRKCYRYSKNARECTRQAMELLRPRIRNRNRNGG